MRAVQLDKQSRASLGVSIRALGLLLQVHQGSTQDFFRKDSLVRDGSWSDLQSLQKNGYATISIRTGLPDGGDPQTEFVVLTLTEKGNAVAVILKSN